MVGCDHVDGGAGGSRGVGRPSEVAVETRPVRPDDIDGLAVLYDGLSQVDRYRRFFSFFRPDREFLERAVLVEARGGCGMVAVVAGPDEAAGQLVGTASYEPLANGNGELAITVAAAWRGGLGGRLLRALLDEAAARGVPNLEGDALAKNVPMLGLARSRGAVMAPSEDTGVVRFVMATQGSMPTWPVAHERPRVLVEAWWAWWGCWWGEQAAAAAGLDVLVCSGPGDRGCPAVAGRPCPLASAADAIVVAQPPRDERWDALVGAHGPQHQGVPVFVEHRGRASTDTGGALPLPHDRRAAIEAIKRAALERSRAKGGPPR